LPWPEFFKLLAINIGVEELKNVSHVLSLLLPRTYCPSVFFIYFYTHNSVMADGVRMLETINAYRILVENPEG
jgi:hypothetical protein